MVEIQGVLCMYTGTYTMIYIDLVARGNTYTLVLMTIYKRTDMSGDIQP